MIGCCVTENWFGLSKMCVCSGNTVRIVIIRIQQQLILTMITTMIMTITIITKKIIKNNSTIAVIYTSPLSAQEASEFDNSSQTLLTRNPFPDSKELKRKTLLLAANLRGLWGWDI